MSESDAYKHLVDTLEARGIDVGQVRSRLVSQSIETPSWGYGNTGTRFGVFPQAGAARTAWERIEDAAQVHQMTGICPRVAVHIPWDHVDDYQALAQFAIDRGMRIGSVNPNVFQDECYQFGSLAHVDPAVRRRAIDAMLGCIDVMKAVDSNLLTPWLADGSNYPGQGDFVRRKRWIQQGLAEVYAALPEDASMCIEYKPFEPAFYHTDIADWGMSYVFCQHLGPRAKVLVDMGHHLPGTNVPHLVAFLLDEGRLGGFHFNDRKYADDDLTTGSINPYEIFLVYNEIVAAEAWDLAFMVDQSHCVKPKLEAMITTLAAIQRTLAKALIVDRTRLAEAQAVNDVVTAEQTLIEAFNTDVEPLLRCVRNQMGVPADPLAAYRSGDYQQKIQTQRVGEVEGASSWG
jgi:L-rhamnose isomerase / sugar isomerase